ncbi:hypothetical protein BGLT_03932 [Caballeronia glathei]|jgi:hypothetical protein|nr:hypothetical protein B0G84_7040 [Paraburkholderia sp. BL8N3]CDY74991.1 hypothetical protein BGLT_03932 [Caballeronia glathei]
MKILVPAERVTGFSVTASMKPDGSRAHLFDAVPALVSEL